MPRSAPSGAGAGDSANPEGDERIERALRQLPQPDARAQSASLAAFLAAAETHGRASRTLHGGIAERATVSAWRATAMRLRTVVTRPVTLAAYGAAFAVVVGLGADVSGALPGDAAYPVKRGQELARLAYLEAMQRDELCDLYRLQMDAERVAEVARLVETGRKERVAFDGQVEREGEVWRVAGLPVILDGDTAVESEGPYARVEGVTSPDGVVAERIAAADAPHLELAPP